VRLQRLKATAQNLSKPRLKNAVAAVESNRTSPATPRLKSAVEAAESNRCNRCNRAVEEISAKRCGHLRIFQPLCNRGDFNRMNHTSTEPECLTMSFVAWLYLDSVFILFA